MCKSTLTLGIPTYNRADLLPHLLDNLLEQITPDISDRIDISICDNASSDQTESVVHRYIARHPNIIHYVKNEINIGFSANVDRVVRISKGDYVLIMSDDDALEPYALSEVLDTLNTRQNIGLITLAYQSWNKDLTSPARPFFAARNKFYETGTEFVNNEQSFPPALISGYVVNKALWASTFQSRYLATNSIHLIMGLKMLAKASCCVLRDKPYVKYREEMGHWRIDTDPLYPFPLFINYLIACQAVKDSYPDSTLTTLYCTTIRTTIGHAIRNKVLGYTFPKEKIRALFAPHLNSHGLRRWIYTTILQIIITTPRQLLYIPFKWLVPTRL